MDPHQGFYDEYMDLASSNAGNSRNQVNGADIGYEDYPAYGDSTGFGATFGASQAAWPHEIGDGSKQYASYGAAFDQDGMDEYCNTVSSLPTSSATPETQPSSKTSSSSSSSGKKSASATAKTAAGDSASKKKPKAKAKSAKEIAAEEELKRLKFLERNRRAASKCRQKKKEYVSGLEGRKEGLEVCHANLQREYQGLIGEISLMKNQLMQHAACNDSNIDQWLENEARKFVSGGSSGGVGGGSGISGSQ